MASSEDNNNNDDPEMGFQHRAEMNPGSIFNKKSSSGSGLLFGSGWDPLENFGGSSSSVVVASHTADFNGGCSSAYPYQSVPRMGDLVPKIGSFGSGGFSEMVKINPFVNPNLECGTHRVSEEDYNSSSPNRGEKRRAPHSQFNPIKNDNGERRNEQDEKKQKIEHGNGIASPNLRGKMGKQANENCDSGGALKNYIHVKAKRGQATNSHSLAERVRREKISERMKLLQELVPGCNKITGKIVMLDEIINYVQMLQQQVEFLSMKLATVNPEPNIDFDHIMSKDILHSQGSLPGIRTTTPPFHPQPAWDNDLHNLLQMGFNSNPVINNLEPNPNGHAKLKL